MSAKKVYELTQDGIDKLKEELSDLKDNKRPENLQLLAEARAQGDLSENADYDAARDEQGKIEARISEIENILKNTKIIKASTKDVVDIGKSVKLKFLDRNEVKEFYLVGTLEANPALGKISVDSILGKSILNHAKGDVVHVRTQTNKSYHVEILEVLNGVA